MIRIRAIYGCLLVIVMAVYFLRGNADSSFWSSYDFTSQDLMVIFLILPLLKKNRDKLLSVVYKVFLGIAVFKLILDVYSFFDKDVFNLINRSYEIGGIIVICILIFIIYLRYGLVKR